MKLDTWSQNLRMLADALHDLELADEAEGRRSFWQGDPGVNVAMEERDDAGEKTGRWLFVTVKVEYAASLHQAKGMAIP